MTVILGLNINHFDTSASLLIDGKLVAAIAEERLGDRVKNTSKFPENAIAFVLQQAGVLPYQVDYVGISRNPKANLARKLSYAATNPNNSLRAFITAKKRDLKTGMSVQNCLEKAKRFKVSDKGSNS